MSENLIDMDLVDQVIDLDGKLAQIKADEKRLKDDRGRLERLLVEQMQANGVQNLSVSGRKLYLRTDKKTTIPAENRRAVVEYFEDNGYDDLVSVNTTSFKSWAKDYREENGDLPAELQGKVREWEVTSVRNIQAS